jgi:vacuolar protein sorting-associated protein 13A/C
MSDSLVLEDMLQIFMPHPRYPSTRVALRVPLLGFHFSPARYHRLMAVVDAVVPKSEPEQKLDERNERGEEVRPWGPAEMEV